MNKYLPHVVCVLCFLLGLSVGWYFGFTRPSVQNERRIMLEYQRMRDGFGLSDKQMAELGAQLPEMLKAQEQTDGFAALMAMTVFTNLDRGDLQGAKEVLEQTISLYLREHRQDGDRRIVQRIERYAATNAALSNAICTKME